MIQCLTDGIGHYKLTQLESFLFSKGREGSHGTLNPVFAPFRGKSLTGFAEKEIVFMPAASSGLSNGVNKKLMKLFLLQLPIQGHDFFYSKENIPLAASYLQWIAEAQGIDAELLPNPLMSYGNDQSILRFLVDSQPDMVAMSCYL
jgi:hypothetical protein